MLTGTVRGQVPTVMSNTGFVFVLLPVFASLVHQISCSGTNHAAEWSYYGPNAPEKWSSNYHDCARNHQSPIDVNTRQAVLDDRLDGINMVFTYGEDANHTVRITNNGFSGNNGHSVYVLFSSALIRLSGGNMRNSYRVAGVHFHWGKDDSEGSEHTINGARYPLEMHVVSYDEEHYTNLDDAMTTMKAQDSLAVIGEVFEISDVDNPDLAPLVEVFGNISTPGSSATFANFDLRKLLPSSLTEYYRYAGSLTTPPCFEKVVWTVLRNINTVSKAQLAKFRSLQLEGPETNRPKIQSNWRATQPLNGRTVYKSFVDVNNTNVSGYVNAATSTALPLHLTTSAALITAIYCIMNRSLD